MLKLLNFVLFSLYNSEKNIEKNFIFENYDFQINWNFNFSPVFSPIFVKNTTDSIWNTVFITIISCYLSLTALFESVSFSQSRFSAFPISGKWIIGLAEVLGGAVTATGSGCERIDWICGGSSTRGFAWGGFGRFGEFSGRFLGFFGAFLLDSELIDAFLGRIFATEVGLDDFWAFLKIQLATE